MFVLVRLLDVVDMLHKMCKVECPLNLFTKFFLKSCRLFARLMPHSNINSCYSQFYLKKRPSLLFN